MTQQHFRSLRGLSVAVLVSLGFLACAESQPTSPDGSSVLAAKGGGRDPGPKVNEAVPSEAPQDTTLVVRVIGSGFDDGSVVRFLLAGQSAPKVVVNSSHFVDEQTLDVDVTIALDADTALYDIEVMTRRGKKGIGSELFAVKVKGGPSDTPVNATFRNASGDGVVSDLGGSYDAVVLAIGNLFLDARVDIARQLCLDFAGQVGAPADVCDDGYLSTADPSVEGGLLAMAPGSTMTSRAQVTWIGPDASGKGYNWALRFGMDCHLNDVASHRLTVAHAPDGVAWTLEGTTAILCRMPTKGRPQVDSVGTFAMPFALTVVR
jgi:hypothetical protein